MSLYYLGKTTMPEQMQNALLLAKLGRTSRDTLTGRGYTLRHGRFSAPVRKCVIAENCTQPARQLRDAPMVEATTGCTIYWRLGHRFVVALETLSDWLACSEVLSQAVDNCSSIFRSNQPVCKISPAQRTFISSMR